MSSLTPIQVWNNATSPRAVLIVDVWNPKLEDSDKDKVCSMGNMCEVFVVGEGWGGLHLVAVLSSRGRTLYFFGLFHWALWMECWMCI